MASPIASSDKSTTGHALRPLLIPWPVRLAYRALASISPRAAASFARSLFFRPPRAWAPRVTAQAVPGGEPFVLQSQGETIRGTTWGSGPTVLLVHGWAGHSSQMTPFVAPSIAAGFRVVAADMPAHGRSSGKLSSVVHFERAMRDLSARFGPLQGIVAHSFGAAATTFAAANGLELDRAVFISPPSRFETFWSRYRDALGISPPILARMAADSEAWLGIRFEEATPLRLASRMRIPLLVIHDAGDREVPFEEGLELAAAWPGAQIRRTEQLGHNRILRDPGVVAAAVEFLAGATYSTVTRKNFTSLSSLTSSR